MNKSEHSPLDRVLHEMKRLGLNNQQMAAKFGITKSTWNNWKNRGLPPAEYPMIAAKLGWQLEYLVRGTEGSSKATHEPLNVEILCGVIVFIEEWLQENDLAPPADIRARVITAFYDQSMRMGTVDKQSIGTMLKLMAANF